MKILLSILGILLGCSIGNAELPAFQDDHLALLQRKGEMLDPLFCPTDFNNDGITSNVDMLLMLSSLGAVCDDEGCPCQDLNDDGIVNVLDVRVFLMYFGTVC